MFLRCVSGAVRRAHGFHKSERGFSACSALLLFFFSSRRRHTRSDRDWSSDVCSSDLTPHGIVTVPAAVLVRVTVTDRTDQVDTQELLTQLVHVHNARVEDLPHGVLRSEERRVGKECRSRWSPYH